MRRILHTWIKGYASTGAPTGLTVLFSLSVGLRKDEAFSKRYVFQGLWSIGVVCEALFL